MGELSVFVYLYGWTGVDIESVYNPRLKNDKN
jgi:hypothetical protein